MSIGANVEVNIGAGEGGVWSGTKHMKAGAAHDVKVGAGIVSAGARFLGSTSDLVASL